MLEFDVLGRARQFVTYPLSKHFSCASSEHIDMLEQPHIISAISRSLARTSSHCISVVFPVQ